MSQKCQRSGWVTYIFTLVLGICSLMPFSVAVGAECLDAPVLPLPSTNVVNVSTANQLENAVSNATDGQTILIAPGEYQLSASLVVRKNNLSLIGDSERCDEVVLKGNGMDNSAGVTHGIWTNKVGLVVRNLTIRDVYSHSLAFNNGAQSPQIYNVRLLNAGEQFIKSNKGGSQGVDDGMVEYTIMEYTDGAPSTDHGGGTGYTNGVDVHGGKRWVIRNNLFKNFHTPDSADNLWNPAILMWRGAGETVTENNVFINCDRAIAYGLQNDDGNGNSHSGGVIRNNMIYYSPNLFSGWRTQNSDAAILVWDSPGTKVYHNSALTNGNTNKFIEFRWDTTGAEALNNLSDNIVSGRTGAVYDSSYNYQNASADMFVNPAEGNLRLTTAGRSKVNTAPLVNLVATDIDGNPRASETSVGAQEIVEMVAAPMPPSGLNAFQL